MDLTKPVPGGSNGTWDDLLNALIDQIDAHDHTSSKGARVPLAGLIIATALVMNGYDITDVRSVRLANQGGSLAGASDLNCVFVVNGELAYRDASGNVVQLTSGGGINIASVGTIGGDYGQPGVDATVTYSDVLKLYLFLQDSGTTAAMLASEMKLAFPGPGEAAMSHRAQAGTVAYNLDWPVAGPAGADSVPTFNAAGIGLFKTISQLVTGTLTGTPTFTNLVTLANAAIAAATFGGATFNGVPVFNLDIKRKVYNIQPGRATNYTITQSEGETHVLPGYTSGCAAIILPSTGVVAGRLFVIHASSSGTHSVEIRASGGLAVETICRGSIVVMANIDAPVGPADWTVLSLEETFTATGLNDFGNAGTYTVRLHRTRDISGVSRLEYLVRFVPSVSSSTTTDFADPTPVRLRPPGLLGFTQEGLYSGGQRTLTVQRVGGSFLLTLTATFASGASYFASATFVQ